VRWYAALVAAGSEIALRDVWFGRTWRANAARVVSSTRELVERRSRRKLELCDRADLLPGVVAYLADARRLLLKTAIVTRGSEEWVQHHLARVCLGHSWDVIVCADGAHTRPKSEFYLEALTRLEVASSEAIAFEDSPHGVRAAREARVACVAIPNKVTCGGSFEEADVVLASLADRPLADLIASVEPR
jgi:HAD superfamily hydrolase (TIGR01509 family)